MLVFTFGKYCSLRNKVLIYKVCFGFLGVLLFLCHRGNPSSRGNIGYAWLGKQRENIILQQYLHSIIILSDKIRGQYFSLK